MKYDQFSFDIKKKKENVKLQWIWSFSLKSSKKVKEKQWDTKLEFKFKRN